MADTRQNTAEIPGLQLSFGPLAGPDIAVAPETPTEAEKVLRQLALHPLSSSRQVARYMGKTESAARSLLSRLLRDGLAEKVNPHEAILPVRALYLPTAEGLSRLAGLEGVTPEQYACSISLSRRRLLTLAVRSQTSYEARNVMLGLSRLASLLRGWRAMARVSSPKGVLLLDAAGTYKFKGRIIQVAVELDSGPRAETQIEKLYSLLSRYPALQLVVVCWSKACRDHYLSLIRSEALALGMPLLPTYVVLGGDLVREGYRAPIWYSNYDRQNTSVFSIPGQSSRPRFPWPPPEVARSFTHVLSPSFSQLADMVTRNVVPTKLARRERLAGLSLALSPLQKQILELIARHCLLNETELASLTGQLTWRIRAAVTNLVQWGLLQVPMQDDLQRDCFALDRLGMAYLAARAGWGTSVAGYARSMGWQLDRDGSPHLERFLVNFEHTRALNAILVTLRTHPDVRLLEWVSEPGTRTCFVSAGRWHCVKPDARGIVQVAGKEYRFVLELERTTTSLEKLRSKLLGYYRWWQAGQSGGEVALPLVLMVTTGRRRARTIVGLARRIARERHCRPIPLLVTWHKQLVMSGVLAPIWLGLEGDEPRRCFE